MLRFIQDLDEEQGRAVREGLDEESLVLYDILRKPDLSKEEIARIKHVAVELLATLRAEIARLENWREKAATRDAIKLTINDFLYSDDTGLPLSYPDDKVREKSTAVFAYVFDAYPSLQRAA